MNTDSGLLDVTDALADYFHIPREDFYDYLKYTKDSKD